MVVINEVYPSRREFIATYVDNKRKNAGITGLQNTKNTFRLMEPTPTTTDPNQKPTLLFTSNFKKFVADIENHLSEILSNDRKIDNIHSAMNDINKLNTQSNNNNNSEERPKSPVEPNQQINMDLPIKSPRTEKTNSSNNNISNNNNNNKNKTKTKNRNNRTKGVNIKNKNENIKQEKTASNPPPSPQDKSQKAVAHIPGPASIIKNKKTLESQLKIKITSNYRTVVINREAFNSWYFKKYLSKPISEQQREPVKYTAKTPKDNNNSITTTKASKLRENFFKYKTNNATTQNNVVSMPVPVVNLNQIQ